MVAAALQELFVVRDRTVSGKVRFTSTSLCASNCFLQLASFGTPKPENYQVRINEDQFVSVTVNPSTGRQVRAVLNGVTYDVDLSNYKLETYVVEAKISVNGGQPEKVLVQLYNRTSLGYTLQYVGTLVRISIYLFQGKIS